MSGLALEMVGMVVKRLKELEDPVFPFKTTERAEAVAPAPETHLIWVGVTLWRVHVALPIETVSPLA